jgi:hypothetical protein
MSGKSNRSPIYDPTQGSPQSEETPRKNDKPLSPLSGLIRKEDMILIWTGMAIIILVIGVTVYYNYGPPSMEIVQKIDDTIDDIIDPVGDIESI